MSQLHSRVASVSSRSMLVVPAMLVLAAASNQALADVVIRPTAVPSVSTWRACVPPENTINGSGLTTGDPVNTSSAIPVVWPVHATGGCNTMWHSSCLGQANNTGCEGGDLSPVITFDLGAEWTLSGFRLWNHNQVAPAGPSETNRGWRTATISYSSDGTTFSDPVALPELAQASGLVTYAGESYAISPLVARFVRFSISSNWGATSATGLSEIRFIGTRFAIANPTVAAPVIEDCAARVRTISVQLADPFTGAPVEVTANLAAIDGPTIALRDDGSNGDATANDGVYSASFPVDSALLNGTYSIPVSALSNGNTASVVASLVLDTCFPSVNENADAGDLPTTAVVASGSGTLGRIRGTLTTTDIDMYKIQICDVANFSATTDVGTTFDTQLFLFNANGVGVAFNDDGANNRSTIDNTLVTEPGEYYLAVGGYNRDPQDASAALLWNNTPFTGVRAPDGPGAANPVAQWTGTGLAGSYTIGLTGACFVGPAGCGPSDVAGANQSVGSDGFLTADDIIVFLGWFFASDSRANVAGANQSTVPDNVLTADDIIVFLGRFFAGC